MVGWELPPDVRFDHVAAEAAVSEARRTLVLLEGWMTWHTIETRPALEAWSGASRERAEATLLAHGGRVSEIASRLRLLVGSLERSRDTALFEQGRRTAQQLDWESQRRSHELRLQVGPHQSLPDPNARRRP